MLRGVRAHFLLQQIFLSQGSSPALAGRFFTAEPTGKTAHTTRLRTQKAPSEALTPRGWSGGRSGMSRRELSAGRRP